LLPHAPKLATTNQNFETIATLMNNVFFWCDRVKSCHIEKLSGEWEVQKKNIK
jgi:hypothetical protein